MESKCLLQHSKTRTGFIYDDDFGKCIYEELHFMQPERVRMTFDLTSGYGLFDKMTILRPTPASAKVISQFHDEDYIEFLEALNTSNYTDYLEEAKEYNIGDKDCPIFGSLYNYCQLSVGGSILAAAQLNQKKFDIAINWMGGLHHAKKGGASGFCYTNDIVLGIMELLKFHQRVLYIDIDVHHGDGVEEAFAATNRVMTVSFHKYGTFFPHSGHIGDIGIGEGKGYSVNVPLHGGITDSSYQMVFKPIMYKVMEFYNPHVVVLQCGADSLCGDRLGPFNMTLKGHGECLNYMKSFNVPLMVLGGGGYTPENVARCWTYETAIACDMELGEKLPNSRYDCLFGKKRLLHIEPADKIDMNSREYISLVQQMVFQNLDNLDFVPSVQMLQDFEREFKPVPDEIPSSENADPDERLPAEIMDEVIKDEGEYYDSESESGSIHNAHDVKQEIELELKMEMKEELEDEQKYQIDHLQDNLMGTEVFIPKRYKRIKKEENDDVQFIEIFNRMMKDFAETDEECEPQRSEGEIPKKKYKAAPKFEVKQVFYPALNSENKTDQHENFENIYETNETEDIESTDEITQNELIQPDDESDEIEGFESSDEVTQNEALQSDDESDETEDFESNDDVTQNKMIQLDDKSDEDEYIELTIEFEKGVKIEGDEEERMPQTIQEKPEAKKEEETEKQTSSDDEKENVEPEEQGVNQEVSSRIVIKQEAKTEQQIEYDIINGDKPETESDEDSGYGSPPEEFKTREDELVNELRDLDLMDLSFIMKFLVIY
ncbi:unnamed protein product [Caenorhabditis brenneri]